MDGTYFVQEQSRSVIDSLKIMSDIDGMHRAFKIT